MRYMLLVHHNEQSFGKLSETEQQQMRGKSVLAREINSSGQYLAGAPQHPTSTATSIRMRDGKRFVTGGPLAKTREQVGGYFLIDAKDSTGRSASPRGSP